MNTQPRQPTELEAAMDARDYWYKRATELEAERTTLTARVAELERELSDATVWGQACDDVRAELEQQLQAQAGQDEAIATLKLVYRKHHLGDDSIGWDELGDAVLDTLSNLMGVDELVRWQEGSES